MKYPPYFPRRWRGVAFEAVQVAPAQRSNRDLQRGRMAGLTNA